MKNPTHILIVDDEEDLTWSIAKGLGGSVEHDQILCANSAENALKILEKSKIHVMVTDIRMPGMGGIKLIDTVMELYPDMQIIVMSAHTRLDELEDYKHQIYYIEKPFEIHELISLINKCLHFTVK